MKESAKKQHTAVIGGGLLGMVLAHRLVQQGKSVTLFEGSSTLGGLARAWQLGDVVWDRHYHVILSSDTYLRTLLAELGLEQEIQWVETKTGFYTDGNLCSLSNTLEFLRFPYLPLIAKLRLGATIFYASRVKDWRRLEKILAVDWLRRWSGKRTCEKIWEPLLRAKLGENYKQTSAAFIWATIARMYAARRTGLKKEMFGYVPGGYSRILQSFTDKLVQAGVQVMNNCAVSRLTQSNGSLEVTYDSGKTLAVDQAVLTVPAPLASQICSGLTGDEKSRLTGVQYQGIICASLLLKKPLAGFYVTNITDANIPFTAVIEMSALVDKKEFGGHSLVYLPKYVTSSDPAFSLTDEEIQELFMQALLRMYPNFKRDDLLSFRVSRVPYVFPIPRLNYSSFLPNVATSIPGVYILNSAHILNGTLNVNETVQLAEKNMALLTV